MYMLDTNICIYIIKKQPVSVFNTFQQLSIGDVNMSLVTYGQLGYGALRSNNTQRAQNVLTELINYIPVAPMSDDVGKHYADIRAGLAAKGQLIGNNDLWIAAHARSMGATLVTNNVREFDRVEGLVVENWI